MEKSEVIRIVMRSPKFRERVRAIAAVKAYSVLQETTPDAGELAWAKLAVENGYDAWIEAMLILANVQPATVSAALEAADTVYNAQLVTVLPYVVLAKGL